MNSSKKNEKTSLLHFSEKSRHIVSHNNNQNNNNVYNKSYNNNCSSSTSCSSKDKDDIVQGMSSNVLRRERFIFDNVFVGVHAMLRLSLSLRQKTRICLESARNLLIISMGCGEPSSSSSIASSIEPPVSLLVGGEGGTGLISIVLDEVFRYIKPLTSQLRSDPSRYLESHQHQHPHVGSSNKKRSTSLSSSSSSSFIGLQNTYEQFATKVILSAVIVSDGEMYDLLDTSSKESNGQHKRDDVTKNKIAVRKRKSDGKYMLFNASKIQLQSTADFDRMIGLLLGRRSAMSRLAHTLLQKHSVNNNINNSTAFQLIEEIDPWVLNTSSLLRNGSQPPLDTTSTSASQASFDQAPNTSSSDSMFISISACGGGVSKSKPTVDFNFVCPCGKNWSVPGE